jgi:hypothetical protein
MTDAPRTATPHMPDIISSDVSDMDTGQSTFEIKRPKPFSRRTKLLLLIWLFGWPLLVFVWNPLARPHDTLTLLLVVPGGALWVLAFLFAYNAMFRIAMARWPIVKTVRDLFHTLVRAVLWIFC